MVEPTLKNCSQCGAVLTPSQRHCHECGALARTPDNTEILNYGECPACGRYSTLMVTTTSKPKRHLKCGKCGARFVTIEIFTTHHDCFKLAGEILAGSKTL